MTITNYIELAGIELSDLTVRGLWKVAAAKTTPEAVLLEIVEIGSVLEAVAANRSATATVLSAVWAKSIDLPEYSQYGIFKELAKNPNTPTDIMDTLTKHKYADIRKVAYGHRNTSLELVEYAAKNFLGSSTKTAVKELARRNAATD